MILGHKSRIFIYKESTWASYDVPDTTDTNVDPWYSYELYARPGSRPRKTASTINSPFITGGRSVASNSFIQGKSQVDGGYSLYISTHGMQNLLYLITGDTSATGDAETESEDVQTFETKLSGIDYDIPSCTIFHSFGGDSTNLEGSVFRGMMMNQMSVNCGGEDSLGEMNIGFLGKDETWVADFNNPSLTEAHKPGEYYIGWKARLYIGAAGKTDTSGTGGNWGAHSFFNFSMSYNNNLAFPGFTAGDTFQQQPEVANTRNVSGSFTLPFNGASDYTASSGILDQMFDPTSKSLRFDFQRFVTQDTNTASDYFTMIFPNVIFTGDGSPGSVDQGLVRVPVSFTATAGDGSVSEVFFIVNRT